MGFFSSLGGMIQEANDGAHSIRLLRDTERTLLRVRELRQDILVEAGELAGTILLEEIPDELEFAAKYDMRLYLKEIRKQLPPELNGIIGMNREQRLRFGRNFQKQADNLPELSAGESLAMWVVGLYLESTVRDAVEATKANYLVKAIVGRMLLEIVQTTKFQDWEIEANRLAAIRLAKLAATFSD